MGKSLPVFYDCLNCPSYCCTYPRIPVTQRDIRRLARHFEVEEDVAERRFAKPGWTKRERVLRHKKDKYYGSACRFLDTQTRLCTVHAARPAICRSHPTSSNCGYYTFLMAERRDQDDPELVARAYNLPEDIERVSRD